MKRLTLLMGLLIVWQFSQSQKLIFFNAKKLPEEINSDLDETLPILSEDEQTLYFVRSGLSGGKGGEDIWYSTRTGINTWSEAKNDLENLNNKESNFIIGISRTNNRLYLRNAYDKKQKHVISVAGSNFENGEWQKPYSISALPDLGFKGKHYSMYISHNEKYLFISMNIPGSVGQEDLYLLTKDDNDVWSAPLHLGENINSKGVEFAPFITEDGKYLFFSSDGHGGFGDMDIFMSQRLDDTYEKWSDPINLGININSKGFDAYFHVSHGKTVFYSSTRGGATYEDIYTSEMHVFEKQKRTVIIHDLDDIEVIDEETGEKFRFVTIPSMKDYFLTHRNDTMVTGDLSEYEYNIVFQLDSNSDLEEKLQRLKTMEGYGTLEQLLVDHEILKGEHIDFESLDATLQLLEEMETAIEADSMASDSNVAVAITPEPEKTITPEPAEDEIDPAIFNEKHIVYFNINTNELSSDEQKALSTFAEKGKGKLSIVLTSYTCDLGTHQYNKSLSEQRMNTVANELKKMSYSISSKTFKGQLKGSDEAERSTLRRVEIQFEKK